MPVAVILCGYVYQTLQRKMCQYYTIAMVWYMIMA